MTTASANTVNGDATLVVGDAALLPTGIHVDDYLQAMGEMAHRKVNTVIGRVEPMRPNMDATVRALRQVAPGAKMILVAAPADEPDAMRAVRLGFDEYVVEPVTPGKWDQLLAAPPAVDRGVAASADMPPNPQAHTNPADPQVLDQLLSDRGSVRQTILDALETELGSAVTWMAEPDLDAHACVPIMHQTLSLGYLVSDKLTDRQIVPWADWAAKWLAVEHRINRLRHLAWHDELTEVWNRRYFLQFLDSVLRRAQAQHFRVTLLLFDIDNFKHYNDTYGHDAGDEILREAARLMVSVVRRHDVVARIGGDEFAVIFWDADAPRRENAQHPHSPQRAAARFQRAICDHRFPKLADCAPGTLTISGGLASYPWDGQRPDELIAKADEMLLSSKRQGKNCITLGPGAIRVCGVDDEAPADDAVSE